jgi:intein/homing endonuclease
MAVKEDISKEFGENIISSANSIIDRKQVIIPISPGLDIALNGGVPEGSFFILTGQPKVGKLQRLTDIIYTPKGPTQLKNLKVGDLVCSPNGKTTKVVGLFPQGKKDIYRVTFNDGSKTYCGLDHNWTVSKNNRQTNWKTITLKEILDEGLKYTDRWKWKIPVTKPVYFKQEKRLPIDPYILGCLIGDGGITKSIIISSGDEYILDKFQKYCDENNLSFKRKDKYDYSISGNFGGGLLLENTLRAKLKTLNLFGKNSHNKFIPKEYLYASTTNRFKLMQGLMDTDGSNMERNRTEYSTTSKQLAKDVQELAQSLGYLCRIKKRFTSYSGKNGKKFPSYRLTISGNTLDKLFSLPRKKTGKVRIKPNLFRTITKVEKVANEEAMCIKIENPDGLYLTNDFIVTHNTSLSLDFAATAQKSEYQGTLKKPREVYYLNIEGRLKKRDLEGISGLDLNRFHVIGSQEGKILHAEEYLQIGEKIINEVPGCILIVDSYSALCTEAEITSDMDKMQRADGAKLLAKFCRKVGNVIPVNKNIVIGITHLMGNPTGYGSEWKEKGGQAITYQTDVKLRAKKTTGWTLTTDGEQIGQEVEWQVVWSSLGSPNRTATAYLRYGQGLDKQTDVANLAADMGLITKAGAWYTLKTVKDTPKFQGIEKVRNYLVEHPEVYLDLLKTVKETMGIKCE